MKRKTELYLDRNGWIRERLIKPKRRKRVGKAQGLREQAEEAAVLSEEASLDYFNRYIAGDR